MRGCSSAGRATVWQTVGRGFKSHHLHDEIFTRRRPQSPLARSGKRSHPVGRPYGKRVACEAGGRGGTADAPASGAGGATPHGGSNPLVRTEPDAIG